MRKIQLAVAILACAFAFSQPVSAESLYRPAVEANGFLFVSGQNAQTNDENLSGDIKQQTKAAIKAITATLEKHGYNLSNVVEVTVALASQDDFKGFNEVYGEHLSGMPARSTALGVLHQDKGALVEISMVAYKAP